MNKVDIEIRGESFWLDKDDYDKMIEFKKNPYAYREKYKEQMKEGYIKGEDKLVGIECTLKDRTKKFYKNMMLEENKYYTPEIEELHVNFEYEVLEVKKNGEEWKKINDFSNAYDYEDSCLYGFIKDLDKGRIRVKYLDKQDIEELGWIVKEESNFSITFFLTKTRLLNRYKLVFEKDSNRTKSMSIYELGGISYIPIFIGTIKNKSELKKLMKQSNII